MSNRKKTLVTLIGCGAIGTGIAQFLDSELHGKVRLAALCDQDIAAARLLAAGLTQKVKVLGLEDAIACSDLVIEAASSEAVKQIFPLILKSKKDVMVLSVGAFVSEPDFLKRASRKGIRLYVPSGAIAGTDAISALTCGDIQKITLTTSKPPRGLKGAPYLLKKNINLDSLTKPKIVFKGSVLSAIKHFPKNINVAATLLLASQGSRTEVVIVADPQLKRNVHSIEIRSRQAHITIQVQNTPSLLNPRTSALAILSAQAQLKKLFSPLKIGS